MLPYRGISRRKQRQRWLAGFLGIATLLLLLLARSPASAAMPKHYTELEFPPLPEIQVPEYARYQLDNGMVVFLLQDRELPLVQGKAYFHTGKRLEPEDKVGLASLTAEVMRSGGTEEHAADELNQLLAQKAAAVETSMSRTYGQATFNALSEDTELVMSLFAEVLRQPVFDQQKLELAKTQNRGQISRRNDDPGEIASREFRKLVYGDRSPYARTTEYHTIDNITRDDLVAFYQQYIHPNNAILGIVGDFDMTKMRSLVEKTFADWQPKPDLDLPPLPEVEQARQSGVFTVDRPQLTQSYVRLGHLGGKINNPDFPALSVLNQVLNGFGGRLFDQIRSQKGLAYSVYGVWQPRYDYPGYFIAGGQTQSKTTVPFIQAILEELERVRQEPITSEELNQAQESTLNSFVFNFDSPEQILSRLMRYEYYDYPQNFIFQYREAVENTTIEQVQQAAQEYLHPNRLVTLVVGNTDTIEPPLSSLGENVQVESLDISIPEPQKS
ncbi:pitrilysin family protein [Geitlerinema sp. PCC 9228]|uniref:M16 family metallopeptidase n=1 Tax=Geitlerinema sp. PCC 9228 TaxID=111611 RepID=UPI0008F9AF91|nr:pitrilysin family protein [Geitlerinema sp. PCC 9228]